MRFARAKGSKASNERVPEEATPWHELKKQMEETGGQAKRKEFEAKRDRAYQDFVQQEEIKKSANTSWAEFENDTFNRENPSKMEKPKKKKLKKLKKKLEQDKETFGNLKEGKTQLFEGACAIDKKRRKRERRQRQFAKRKKPKLEETKDEQLGSEVINESKTVKQLLKLQENSTCEGKEKKTEVLVKNVDPDKIKRKKERRMRQIEKRKKFRMEQIANVKQHISGSIGNIKEKLSNDIAQQTEQLEPVALNKIQKKKEKKLRQLEIRKKFKLEAKRNNIQKPLSKTNSPTLHNAHKNSQGTLSKPSKIRQSKLKDPGKHNIRPDTRITVDGNFLDIAYFDGFPIRKDDQTRLVQLKKDMVAKGIPHSQIKVALKLERRKAEKALTRGKKQVCFNCRGSGHWLSECPKLQQEQAGTGICFKCGSTEHTHTECKAVLMQEFKFAQCFVCKEQGHIARQCPDNAKGLYPRGGACRVCGDVTHLQKDCPLHQAEQEEKQLTLGTIDSSSNIEGFMDHTRKEKEVTVCQNKIIKF